MDTGESHEMANAWGYSDLDANDTSYNVIASESETAMNVISTQEGRSSKGDFDGDGTACSDNNSSSGSSDTRSLTTDDWAAIAEEPEDDYSAGRPEPYSVPDIPLTGLSLAPFLNREGSTRRGNGCRAPSDKNEYQALIQSQICDDQSKPNSPEITEGASGIASDQLDTRKDYLHFNVVPLEKMIRMGHFDSDGYEKPKASGHNAPYTIEYSHTAAVHVGQEKQVLKPCGQRQSDPDSSQQSLLFKEAYACEESPTHENQHSPANGHEVTQAKQRFGRHCPTAPDLNTSSSMYGIDGIEGWPQSDDGSDSSESSEESLRPQRPLPLPPRPCSGDSARGSYWNRSSCGEHVYSRISDYEENDGHTNSNVMVGCITSGTEIHGDVPANDYEHLDLTRHEPLKINWNAVRCVMLIVLVPVVVIGASIWALQQYGFFTGHSNEMTTSPSHITEAWNYGDTSPRTVTAANLSRSYMGETATLIWDIHDYNLNVPFTCRDNHNSALFHVNNFNVIYNSDAGMSKDGKGRVEALINRNGNTIGFRINNVTLQDAGTYSCSQIGSDNKVGIIFVWDKPQRAKISREQSLMKCDVTPSSLPELARPPMTFVWRRSDLQNVTKTRQSYLPLPTDIGEGKMIYVSCQGQEEGSSFTSDWSKIVYVL